MQLQIVWLISCVCFLTLKSDNTRWPHNIVNVSGMYTVQWVNSLWHVKIYICFQTATWQRVIQTTAHFLATSKTANFRKETAKYIVAINRHGEINPGVICNQTVETIAVQYPAGLTKCCSIYYWSNWTLLHIFSWPNKRRSMSS